MRNIVLIGMMGSGKTTCGIELAKCLGFDFTDTDDEIEKREKRSINEIFSKNGEEYFRDLESAIIKSLSKRSRAVIATGGGAVLRKENISNLNQNGIIVFLNRSPDDIFDSEDLSCRPLAAGGRENFISLFSKREGIYKKAADITICNFKSVLETVDEIISGINDFNGGEK